MNINYFPFLSFIKMISFNSGNNSFISLVIFCKSSSLLFFLYNSLYLLNNFGKSNSFNILFKFSNPYLISPIKVSIPTKG